MKKRRIYDDDDGRTIADMSGVSRPSAFGVRRPEKPKPEHREATPEDNFLLDEQQPSPPFTREERRVYIFAALKASLLIAAAFIVGLGIIILIMILAWN